MGEFLASYGGVHPYRIMHSGKLRAAQTAEMLAGRLGMDHAEPVPDLEPMADPGIWSAHFEAMYEDVMIVGHLPHVGRLAFAGDREPGSGCGALSAGNGGVPAARGRGMARGVDAHA